MLANLLAQVLRRNGALVLPGPEGLGRAVPRGIGLSMLAVFVAAGVGAALAFPRSGVLLGAWIVSSLAIAAVSLRDDFVSLPVMLRLVVHVMTTTTLVAIAGPIRTIALGGLVLPDLGAAAWPATILCVVGMTNAFNFMDGIAGITAAAAAAALAFAAGAAGHEPAAVVALALSAGSLGVLTSNWPPARVVMGDVGSTFCGFMISAVPR